MDRPHGGHIDVALLRSAGWIADYGAQVGGGVFLDMPEMGACGLAEVVAIQACPLLEAGPGRLVTGTFKHTSGEVYDLKLASESQLIGVTARHPFWSVDRNAWVSAIDLEIGETLKTLTGTTVVESIKKRPEPEPVYNIEVEGDHVYRVGESGVLVHNASLPCPCDHATDAEIDLGSLDSLGRATRVVAIITQPLIDSGGVFSSHPGWWNALPVLAPPDEWQRGHLLGNQLGGPGGSQWKNMVAQHRRSNSPVQRDCENRIRSAVQAGECILFEAVPTFTGNSMYPDRISITAEGDGNPPFNLSVVIPNTENPPAQC